MQSFKRKYVIISESNDLPVELNFKCPKQTYPEPEPGPASLSALEEIASILLKETDMAINGTNCYAVPEEQDNETSVLIRDKLLNKVHLVRIDPKAQFQKLFEKYAILSGALLDQCVFVYNGRMLSGGSSWTCRSLRPFSTIDCLPARDNNMVSVRVTNSLGQTTMFRVLNFQCMNGVFSSCAASLSVPLGVVRLQHYRSDHREKREITTADTPATLGANYYKTIDLVLSVKESSGTPVVIDMV